MMKPKRPWLLYVVDDAEGGGGGGEPTPTPEPQPGGLTQADVDKAVKAAVAAAARAGKAEQDELRAKAARLDKIEADQETEAQRAAKELETARKAAAGAAAEAVRYKAAAKAGVDPESDDFALIGSGDDETVMARATRIGELLAASRELETLKSRQAAPTTKPRPVLRPGAAPANETVRVASVDAAREAAIRRGMVPADQK